MRYQPSTLARKFFSYSGLLALLSLSSTNLLVADHREDKEKDKDDIVADDKEDTVRLVYSDFNSSPASALQEYQQFWFNPYGPGELAAGGTFSLQGGRLSLGMSPFRTSYDFSVYDHIKYLGISTMPVAVPSSGSVTISTDIGTRTSGVIDGKVINGTYIMSGAPYSATLNAAQQACASLNVIDFASGQLFDWLISGDRAFALAERLPSSVTGSQNPVGLNKIFTQFIGDFKVNKQRMNTYSIRYNRKVDTQGVAHDSVDFMINGEVKVSYKNIGIPPDRQGMHVSTYPSLGNGELLDGQIQNLSIGNGIFSLVDAFPFQLSDADAAPYAVSIPVSERIWGQGIDAQFDNIIIVTHTDD